MTDYEKFVQERKSYVGASDQASIHNVGWGCARRLFYDKSGLEPDFDNSDKPAFRRGRRLEAVAADYYADKTGRKLTKALTAKVKGSEHLAANPDRYIRVADSEVNSPYFGKKGYLEIKVVGRESYFMIKRSGLPEDYILQVQYGLAVTELEWGAFVVYWPDGDELLYWDYEAKKSLGAALLEKTDDWWIMNLGHGIVPESLPENSKPCKDCPWFKTCRGNEAIPQAAKEVIQRPDLAGIISKMAEIKGLKDESSDAYDGLRDEVIEAIKGVPGSYVAGSREFQFRASESERFDRSALKKAHPEIEKQFIKTSVTKTLLLKEEKA